MLQVEGAVQIPAPFDYARATSVGNALELLERHGPESRVVAGGHSLLPMMKLRLARPEWLIDINDLAELDLHRRGRRRAADRRADPARRAAGVRRRRPAVPDRARRRAGDRRPGRAQPRHDRRLAVPGGPGRGPRPPSATCCARRVGHRGARRASGCIADGRAAPRPVRDRRSTQDELLTEIRLPVRPRSGSAYEKVERRVGDWAVAAAGAAVTLAAGRHASRTSRSG